MPATLTTRRFTERTASQPGRIDRAAGIIRDVKIIGQRSRNGRTYTAECLSRARPLYEGAAVYCNHEGEPGQSRTIGDKIGWLEGVRSAGDGLRGDLHLLTSHPQTAAVFEMAERRPGLIGLSHNVSGSV